MRKFLFFISIVSLSSIIQAFDNNKSDIQYQEVVSVDIGKLMGAWKYPECFWLNSRDQSDCDRCRYHNKEIEEEIKRRKEQNLKENLKEIFLMLKNNDEAVDLFNGRIYINPERLVYKAGKYYIQDDNMNCVWINEISEDFYGCYINCEEIKGSSFYINMQDEIILCKTSWGASYQVENDKNGSKIKIDANGKVSTENESGGESIC